MPPASSPSAGTATMHVGASFPFTPTPAPPPPIFHAPRHHRVCMESRWTRGKSFLLSTSLVFLVIVIIHSVTRNAPNGWYSSSYTSIDIEASSRCSLTRSNLVEKLDALRQEIPSLDEIGGEEGNEVAPATGASAGGRGMWSAKIAALLDEEEDDKWAAPDYFLALSTLLNCTAPCNTLVFGLSWDASLILEANVLGRTIFLEDDTKWAGIVRRKVPCANTYSVVYSTKLRDWPVYEDPVSYSRLDMTLPLDVVTTPWDLIIVQGPSGDPTRLGAWENPGRMQSIYTASRLASRYFQFPARNSAVSVVVFDADRLVEKRFSDKFLGKENLAMAKGTTRLYRLHENFAQALAGDAESDADE